MKKTLNIILAVSALFAFTACGNPNQSADDAAKQAEVQKQVDDLKEQVSKLKDDQDGVEHKPVAKTEVKTDVKPVEKNVVPTDAEPTKISGVALHIANIIEIANLADKNGEKEVVQDIASITIDTPKDQANLSGDGVTFTGTLSAGATKIVAKSSADNDPYVLQSFKAGSTKFTYKAALAFKNLKIGKNTFEFTATFKDGTTKTATVTINFSK
ncbi:MAG: hypothetical protein NTZ25_00400 [Candidatus Peregrinibacteria bacterium]|nr:hypothetical protein [Candidatus Peregrinibacteria bacterium]